MRTDVRSRAPQYRVCVQHIARYKLSKCYVCMESNNSLTMIQERIRASICMKNKTLYNTTCMGYYIMVADVAMRKRQSEQGIFPKLVTIDIVYQLVYFRQHCCILSQIVLPISSEHVRARDLKLFTRMLYEIKQIMLVSKPILFFLTLDCQSSIVTK